jgi:hypothetical protein
MAMTDAAVLIISVQIRARQSRSACASSDDSDP